MQCTVCAGENADGATQCATCGVTLVSTDDPNVLQPGTSLYHGSYAVGQCVGHGGFGITYRATDLKLRRMVAIKEYFPLGCTRKGTTVKPSGGSNAESYQDGRSRFLQEGEALARFDHTGIVHVYAAFEENDTAYIVMEFLQGKNLEQILEERGGRLPVAEALVCATKLGAALEVVHAAGLLHRDIKPGNIMMVGSDSFLADPRVVLVDFGAAREYAAGVSKTHSVVLTRGYAPLEQYTRQATRGPYTDLYAVAAVLYEALTGAPPHDAPERAYGSVLRDVRTVNPEAGENMGKAIMRGLEMEAGKRPQTVREFLGELVGLSAPSSLAPTQGLVAQSPPSQAAPLPLNGLASTGSQPQAKAIPAPLAPTVSGGRDSTPPKVSAPASRKSKRPVVTTGREQGLRFAAVATALTLLSVFAVFLAGSLAFSELRTVFSTNSTATHPSNQAGNSLAGLQSASTNAKGFQEFINEKDGTALIKIPGGTFQMGSNKIDDEKPPHSVTLPPYLMARVPVTNAQFARFVSATGYDAGHDWKGCAQEWGEQAPVTSVTWDAAMAYCSWAGLRLPTEEEWEFAARGPQGLIYPWGNEWDPSRCQNSVGSNSPGRVAPVGNCSSGASPFGCLDMAGNVWQWTSSWYDRYPGSIHKNDDFGQQFRVLRGGSWANFSPTLFRGASRCKAHAITRLEHDGFRCARSAE